MRKSILFAVSLLLAVALLSGCTAVPAAPAAPAAGGEAAGDEAAGGAPVELSVIHYFSDTLGKEAMAKIFEGFRAANPGIEAVDNSAGHEDFKTQILVTLAGDNPPDVFSYWAGARTQFVADGGRLAPIDDMWAANELDSVIPAGIADGASTYNGQKYLIPIGYHYVGMFYNPKVMADAGITAMPTTWDELMAAAEQLKAAGVTPFALGSKNRWPAQFWFDYLMLRTAGPEYRAKLMAGEASYTDPEVAAVMEQWKSLVDAGYFVENANAYDWNEAADQVANGQAAMTLMGTWITGYWNGNELVPGDDYDFFPFPTMQEGVPNAALGPVDGFVMTAGSQHKPEAEKLLMYLLDPQVQADWAQAQGALAPSSKVDPSIYNVVMSKANDQVAGAEVFAFNYDLATTPPMAEGGLNMFAQFMNDPSKYADYLAETENVAKEVFGKQ
jgi:multiple sugar transport system substrate-binding protein/raffinose/stachyose/melibiose transport system substrate-binding protein